MTGPLKGCLFFYLITFAVFLGCAQRDNQFDPSSPLYVGNPPVLKISCNLQPDQVLQSISDSEFIVRPRATVTFGAGSYNAETDEPLSVNLRVYQNGVLISRKEDVSSEDIVMLDSGEVKVVFETTDQNNLVTEKVYTFTIKLNRKPFIIMFEPKLKEENIVWVGKTKYVDFRTEISDPDSLLDSIFYVLEPNSLSDSVLYIRDTSKSDNKVTTSASTYIDTVTLECYSDSAVDAYVLAIITDKLGRIDTSRSMVYFSNVDLSKHPEIEDIIPTWAGEDSNIVCFNPLVTVYNGDLSNALYSYDFGDGKTSSSNDPNQCHPYTNPGTYSVKLTVMDDGGASDTFSTIVEIRSPQTTKPVKILKLVSTPDTGTYPLNVNFEIVLESDVDTKDVSVFWKFGDGTSKSGSLQRDYTYYFQGKYIVRVILSSRGESDTAYDTIRVYPKFIQYSPKGTLQAGWMVNFWIQNFEQPGAMFLWTLPDTTFFTNAEEKSPLVSFEKGTHEVRVDVVWDSVGMYFSRYFLESTIIKVDSVQSE